MKQFHRTVRLKARRLPRLRGNAAHMRMAKDAHRRIFGQRARRTLHLSIAIRRLATVSGQQLYGRDQR